MRPFGRLLIWACLVSTFKPVTKKGLQIERLVDDFGLIGICGVLHKWLSRSFVVTLSDHI